MKPQTATAYPGRVAALGAVLGLALAAGAALAGDPPKEVIEEKAGEKEQLKACEARVCGMILDKEAKGEDLKCSLEKTWAKKTLKGGETKSVKWGFGDAQCSVDLELSRADIVAALTRPEYSITLPTHQVHCLVEQDGKPQKVLAKLAPKLTFKDGKADKAWINLADIDGPESIKGTVWMAATLEDKLGIFHRSMIKSVNKFIFKRCPENYGPNAKSEVAEGKRKKKGEKAGKGEIAKVKAGEGAAMDGAQAKKVPPAAETSKTAKTQP